MNKSDATHVSKCGKYLYREVKPGRLDILATGIEFYCEYQKRWLPSIMNKSQIVEL